MQPISLPETNVKPRHREVSILMRTNRLLCMVGTTLICAATAHAQVAVSDGGTPTYSQAIAVPPGVAGMSPKLGLFFAGGGVNGPVGYGWSVQGISSITRCPAVRAIDGVRGSVTYTGSDKLCLDGQRLIQTDAAGNPLAFPQSNDAVGLGSGYREFRTEKDTYARIRAYGYANGDTSGASGPAYFKVWTKAGQIYDYGASPVADANTKALITPYGKTVAMAWAAARISDTLGNFIDFKYEQRDIAWGSGPTAGSPTMGHEWNIAEIQYSGNKVVFNYADRAARSPQDAAEAYHQGSKNVSMRLLQSIATYVNSPNTSVLGAAASAVAVKATKLTYDSGPVTGRSRVTSIQECAGDASSTRCLPANTFAYAPGGDDSYQASSNFNLGTLVMQSTTGNYGVLVGDFNGDGKTDFIRWSDNPAENQLYLSNGDGGFSPAANFNITDQNLFKSDDCYMSMAVDINGDGLPDIFRYSTPTNLNNGACGAYGPVYIYISNGDGSFTRKSYAGPVLRRISPGIDFQGENFYLLDVNGDGKPDIVASRLPPAPVSDPPSPDYLISMQCSAAAPCTRVYLGGGNGDFSEIPTNVSDRPVFLEPRKGAGIGAPAKVVDIDGDGLADLAAPVTYFNGNGFSTVPAYRSRGDLKSSFLQSLSRSRDRGILSTPQKQSAGFAALRRAA